MSETLRQSLIDFLGNPRTFMQTNIVLPPSSNVNAAHFNEGRAKGSGISQFSFILSTTIGKRGSNVATPIFRIENPDNYNTDKPRFMAYYCHYDNDQMFDLMLGDEMNLMLTPTMTGCSFGIGSENSSGGRRVAHANVSPQHGRQQQGVDQAAAIGQTIPNATIFGPDDYPADVLGTTVGVRRNGHWTFFVQKWKRPTPGNYILDTVTDIV